MLLKPGTLINKCNVYFTNYLTLQPLGELTPPRNFSRAKYMDLQIYLRFCNIFSSCRFLSCANTNFMGYLQFFICAMWQFTKLGHLQPRCWRYKWTAPPFFVCHSLIFLDKSVILFLFLDYYLLIFTT